MPTHPNIVLFAIDSLLADHMSCYGYARQTTPHIDRFASEGTLFERTYSAHIPTTSAYSSMLTGMDCFSTQVVALRHQGGLRQEVRTLPEILRDKGYNTTCVGFTGNPGSMRPVAEAFAAAGLSVELPRLPGHGTTIEDMMTTTWTDWSGEVEAAYQRLAARTDAIVVAGLSMGGTLTLWAATQHPDIAGIVCINPLSQPQPAEVLDMVKGMITEGETVMPGIGSDIADPEVTESAYSGTPLTQLVSLLEEGARPLTTQYPSMTIPMLLLSSPNDHVVDPASVDVLAADYGGAIERISLDRSFHVATLDFDRELIQQKAVEFAKRVTAG